MEYRIKNCNLCVSQMGRFLMGRFLNVVGVALLGDPKIGYTGRRRQRPLHQKSKFQKQNTIIQITIC